ncbi:D-alanyl-D-alanine carboxypeptidase/D-alanyl-D-alanine-endopeptidase [Vulgatibacter incomptus]|uniref:D-alanyl-D-alanine carboxypeptidase/D-alanyl-D-alanine endopeptidase n=1 Tax=Vulgatibacter incomptus TaxID=1391653 RepID=UPI00067FC649|nr:D-alanyl-D-alanine carboxypeptidase/D-alanyl-D-alanine-endopeptidase [Vulgatibacter incomptus]
MARAAPFRHPAFVATWFCVLAWVLPPDGAHAADPTPRSEVREQEISPELPASIAEILRAGPIRDARTGVLVSDLDTGKVVFARNADELLNPASNMKLLTTVSAMAILGTNFRFATELYVSEPARAGVVKGSLYLRGKGDPSLTTERLFRLARELRHQGVREITGNLVIDDTYFDAVYDGPGWEQDDSDRPYMAGAGAVSLNFNSVGIHVHPGESVGAKARVELEPDSAYLTVENLADTAPRDARGRVVASSSRDGDRQRIVVRARVAEGSRGEVLYRRISNPPRYTGETFRAVLAEQGIKIKGKVVLSAVPAELKIPIVVDFSEPLAVLVNKLNKWSQNHMSEMLLKTIGAEMKGAPGTWAKGAAAMEDFLADLVGIPRGSMVIRNGSGLNDTNRVSARQLVRLLEWVHRYSRIEPELLASLPIAGVDGTTRHRLGGTLAEGRIRAKTGTLQNVTSLSGIVDAVSGKRYAFSIVVNDYPGRLSQVLPRVDAIGAAIASEGSEGGSRSAIALAEPPPSDPSTPLDILRNRISTYADLGRVEESRNATFLRAALRTERDPAVRAVIADALYRSDRGDGSAAVAVVEAFSPGADVFGRLRAAARGMGRVPVLDTLFDLAVAGNTAAISQLVAVSEEVEEGDPLSAELADGFAEIGRTAPDELLAALEGASEGSQAAAIALLGKVIAEPHPRMQLSPIAPHPFNIAVAKAANGVDPRLATFARSVESRLGAGDDHKPQGPEATPTAVAP